jgi:hypothetical protein
VTPFWRMQVARGPRRDLANDIRTVAWLPLAAAIKRLSLPVERSFLEHIGAHALKLARIRKPVDKVPRKRAAERIGKRTTSSNKTTRARKPSATTTSHRASSQASQRKRSRNSEPSVTDTGAIAAPQRGRKNILRQFWGKLRHNAALT